MKPIPTTTSGSPANPLPSHRPRALAIALAISAALFPSDIHAQGINPDPGSGEVSNLTFTQNPPSGSPYDPLVPLPGGEAYAVPADHTGRINLTLDITHNMVGLITTSIRDADGFSVTSATGNTPNLIFDPLKFRYPFIITVQSPTGDPVFTRFLVPKNGGNTLGEGFTGGSGGGDPNYEDDEEYEIPTSDDSGDYDLEGKEVSSGKCGSCQDSCDLTHSDDTSNADSSGENGSFHAGFSAGLSMQGDSSSGVDARFDPAGGVSMASFSAYGTRGATITKNNGNLATITTGSAYTSFENVTGGVKVSISKTSSSDAFRTITFLNNGTNGVKRISNLLSPTGQTLKSVETEWRYTTSGNRTWTIIMGNGARKSELILEQNTSSTRVQRRKLYERTAGSTGVANVLVAEVRETYTKTILGWRKVKSEVIGDSTGPLTTTWEYYGPADGTTKAGLLKSIVRPNGNTELHDYFNLRGSTYHTITRPFAGGGQAIETRRRTFNSLDYYLDERVGSHYIYLRHDK